MNISKNNRVFLLVFIFLSLGLIFLLRSEDSLQPEDNSSSPNDNSARQILVSNKDYASQVRRWLTEASVSDSDALPAVREVKAKILNFHNTDKNLGPAQINLYLAFDYWEKFLVTKDGQYKEQADKNLATLVQLYPELNSDIDKLKFLIN